MVNHALIATLQLQCQHNPAWTHKIAQPITVYCAAVRCNNTAMAERLEKQLRQLKLQLMFRMPVDMEALRFNYEN